MHSYNMYAKQLVAVISWLVLSLLLSCCVHSIDDDVKWMYSTAIKVPCEKMEKRQCSIYAKSGRQNSPLVLLSFISEPDCSSCEVARLSGMEKANIDKYPEVEFVYVVSVKREESEFMYRKLCDARVEGTVYLDTCGAFLSANPQFPSSPLLHTFVMDRDGRVLLVGNPFRSERLMEMFKKVLAEVRGGEQTR